MYEVLISHLRECAKLDPSNNTYAEAADAIEKLSDRNVGKWYGEADGYADGELVYDMWSCPFCGKRFEEWDDEPTWNFCPNCGADMRGRKDEHTD